MITETSLMNPKLEDKLNESRRTFTKLFGSRPDFISVAPGRINIIGEHTDYMEGLSLPAAINRWVWVSFRKRTDDCVEVRSKHFEGIFKFKIGEKPSLNAAWKRFVFGAVELFMAKHGSCHGFDAFINGNVPIGSGVSSSAALEVALVNGLNQLNQGGLDGVDVIKIGQQIEHQYLNVKCGLLDQYASQFSKIGHVMLLDFQQMSHQYTPISMGEYSWILVNSMVKRELAGSEYSKRVDEMNSAVKLLNQHGIKSLRNTRLEDLQLIEDDVLKRRVRHFVSANQRVKDVSRALAFKDMVKVGELLMDSHKSLSEDYEVSCDELDFLAQQAVKISGCLGARMMGGGFGGCTINLVKTEKAELFSKGISEAYSSAFNLTPEVNVFDIVDGAKVYA